MEKSNKILVDENEEKMYRLQNAHKNIVNVIELLEKKITKNCEEILKIKEDIQYLKRENDNYEKLDLNSTNIDKTFQLGIDDSNYDDRDGICNIMFCDKYVCNTYSDLIKVLNNTNLKSLSFGDNFNENIDIIRGKFKDLTSLTFGSSFNKDISGLVYSFPMINKLVIYGHEYNGINEYVEMGKITEYCCISSCDLEKTVKCYNLTDLSFGWMFNNSIDILKNNLPNLVSLTFGQNFNKPIDILKGCFPNLTSLTFGQNFNQPIDALKGCFLNLTSLTFGRDFNQPVDAFEGSFPNLTSLTFGEKFNEGYLKKFVRKYPDYYPKITKLCLKDRTYKSMREYNEYILRDDFVVCIVLIAFVFTLFLMLVGVGVGRSINHVKI